MASLSGRQRRWHLVVAALALAALTCPSAALAATVVVDGGADPDSRLELRLVVLPDGSEAELYVLEGDPIVVVIDDQQRLEARVIEFDPQAREVRIVGPGTISDGDERFEGRDLIVDLRDERFSGRDVLIVTGEIDVWGDLATRVPGQIDVVSGTFSPCSRCDQEPWDYGFVAARLQLFPGDRLVAHEVTILVRGEPIGSVPLLVLPLTELERQPRLTIASGSATRRAEVALRWPYVGADGGLGSLTVRYLAQVDPARGGALDGRLLGGAVDESHLAWEIDHRIYDERGAGIGFVSYLPSLPDLGADTIAPEQWTVRLRYATDASLTPPLVRLGLERDDRRVAGRWEYDLGLTGEADAIRGRFDARGFVDTDAATSAATAPSYASRSEPRRTLARLRLEPRDVAAIDLGPVRLLSAEVDLGAFEDVSDPTNRSAAVRPLSSAGRARVAHLTQLEPWQPWSGFQVDLRNAFSGQYYDTGERLIAWRTDLSLRQAFGNAGSLTLTLERDVNEGETPFRFDGIPRRNTSALGVRLRIAPDARWSLEHDSGYLFLDTRRPEDEGWRPLDTRLQVFRDISAIDLRLRHRYDLGPDDLHTLEAVLALRERREAAELSLRLEHLQDFAPASQAGVTVADTRTALAASAGVDRVARLEVETSYRPSPVPTDDGERRPWSPLVVRADVGSLSARDERPGARIELRADINTAEVTQVDLRVRALAWEAELEATQRVDVEAGTVRDARLSITLPDRFTVVVRGVTWLPLALLGVEPMARAAQPVAFTVNDASAGGPARWEATLRTTLDPTVAGGEPGRRDTTFDLRVTLARERWGPIDLTADAFAEWRLRDDALSRSHLRRATITLGLDAFERIGLQGTLGYLGAYSDTLADFTRSELQLQRVTLTLRPSDQITVGAQFNDVWDFTERRAEQSPWNLRPEVFVVWDRCCWALVAGYDTGSGDLRIALTGPGASTGIEEIIPTPFGLERRPLDGGGGP